MEETSKRALSILGVDIDLNAKLGSLSTARQQLVAIARALVYDAKLLVMDEVLDAVSLGMLDDETLAEFLRNRPEDLEVVMTGRAPTPCTDPLADYITCMEKVRHPFDKGLNARKGVEF